MTYKKPEHISKKDILGTRMAIKNRFGRTPYTFAAYTNQAVLLQVYHCLELVESQSSGAFLEYLTKFEEKEKLSRSEKMFFNHPLLKESMNLAKKTKISHPKLKYLKQIVQRQYNENKDSLVLIFAQFRNTIDSIENTLNEIKEVNLHRFVGQAGKKV